MQELAAERAAVRAAVERLRLTPVLFELGARAHPPRELYLAYLEQSQIFVGIYGEQYGWVAPGQDISGLEDEYVAAAEMPKLVYIKKPASDRHPRLAAMIVRIQSDGLSYRSFGSAQELEQLVADDLAVLLSERFDAPGEVTAGPLIGPRWRLPVATDSFFGRDRELRELTALLTTADVRLVSLVGPGGIGKTRLAFEAARQLRDDYPDGIVAVALAGVRAADHVPAALADALEVAESAGRSPLDAVTAFLGPRRMLLVLDNLEQIPDAGELIGQLLSSTEHATVLATSREVLRLSGEHVYPVPPLPSSTDVASVDAIARVDAVALFVDRAQATRYDLTFDQHALTTVAEICRRLDGLPLAIELAAARVRVIGLAPLLRRLDNRLATLTGGARDAPQRQQTLRGTIQWSYDLLTDDERVLLSRLAVFSGTFSLEAVEAVSRTPQPDAEPPPGPDAGPAAVPVVTTDVLDGVGALVDKSLVRAVDPVDDQPRFAILDIIREFAWEQLVDRGEHDLIGKAHATFFVQLARQIDAEAHHPSRPPLPSGFVADSANFDAAMRWLIDHDEYGLGAELGISLWQLWWMQSRFLPGMAWMDELLARPNALTVAQRADASQVLGLLAFGHGDYPRATPALTMAVQLQRQLHKRAAAATASVPLGLITAETDPLSAHAMLQQSVDQFRELDDDWGLAFALLSLGGAFLFENRFEEAVPLLEESVGVSRTAATQVFLSSAQVNLGAAYVGLGELDAADTVLREALRHAEDAGSREAIARALEGLAAAAVSRKDAPRTVRLMGAAEAVRRSIGATVWMTDRRRHEQTISDLRAILGAAAADEALAVAARAPLPDRVSPD
jgi:predicted ATPase